MRPRISFLVLVLAGAGCAARSGAGAGGGARPHAGASGLAPNDFHRIPIVSAAGQSAPFSVVLAARPTLVSFWAPWCEPCVRELPDLERLARAMAPCGAAVLGVAVGETPRSITAFARDRHLTYPQFTDQGFELADALGQTRIPTTVVFDGGQNIVFVGEHLDGRAIAALMATFGATRLAPGCASAAAREKRSAEGQPP